MRYQVTVSEEYLYGVPETLHVVYQVTFAGSDQATRYADQMTTEGYTTTIKEESN